MSSLPKSANLTNALDDAEFGLDELRLLSVIANREKGPLSGSSGNAVKNKVALEVGSENHDSSESSSRHEPLRIHRDAPLIAKVALIARLSGPVMASCCLQMASGIILMYYAGRLSAKANNVTIFAGVSMANMFANVSYLT